MAVAELAEEYDLQLLAYGRWRISDFRRELNNIGAQITIQPFNQGFKDWHLQWIGWSNMWSNANFVTAATPF